MGTYRQPGQQANFFNPAQDVLVGIESVEKDVTGRLKTVRDFENAAAVRRADMLKALADTEGMDDMGAVDSLQASLMEQVDDLYKLDIASFEGDRSEYLRKQSEHFLTYHKTDSHWNFHGAFSAYQLIQARLREPVYTEALSRPKKYSWGVLDLGGKLIPPLKEKIFYYNSSDRFKRTFANKLVELKERDNRTNDAGLHVGSYVVFENDDCLSEKTIMIFGDSFSEYRDHLLTGLFAETYKEVHFIWNANLDFDLIKKVKPDIVISEMAERFIPKCNLMD